MAKIFLPNEVVLVVPPLAGTMGRAEFEHAAAVVVRVCQSMGNEWRAIDKRAIIDTLEKDITDGTEPFDRLSLNPFFRPDFRGAIEAGFLRWANGNEGPVEFTEKGFSALEPWVHQ